MNDMRKKALVRCFKTLRDLHPQWKPDQVIELAASYEGVKPEELRGILLQEVKL
jgi:hypothetical protein